MALQSLVSILKTALDGVDDCPPEVGIERLGLAVDSAHEFLKEYRTIVSRKD